MSFITNPRQESAENELDVQNQKFKDLGLNPILLNEKLFEEVQEITKKYKDRCIKEKVLPKSYWNKKRTDANATAVTDSKEPVLK
jgi:UDP-sulfoquinovose synthase